MGETLSCTLDRGGESELYGGCRTDDDCAHGLACAGGLLECEGGPLCCVPYCDPQTGDGCQALDGYACVALSPWDAFVEEGVCQKIP